MKSRLFRILAVAPFLALAPLANARNWYVNGMNGSDSNGCTSPTTACKTIKHAISLASSGDSVMVAAATYRENLTIGISLKIIGSSASTTMIDGGYVNTVVTISNTNAHVLLSQVTIQNGATFQGGGIYNNGILTITNSTVSGNIATAKGFCFGGGIYNNFGTVMINKSTISGNSAAGFFLTGEGGGVYNSGTMTISNSTVSGNIARVGGGISNGGRLAINNSTISGNGAAFHGGGIEGSATLQNSIVANSPKGGNCLGTMTSKGYNLSGDNTCNFHNSGDRNNTDPLLGALQNNGGPTQTQALLPGSPAIDAGNPSGCTDSQGNLLKTDQRGYPRHDPEDTRGCDMGAYERQSD